MSLEFCVLSILNNTNFPNQHWQSVPKYRPAWTVCSQHSDYHHSGPIYDVLQQTASHSSRLQKNIFEVEKAKIAQTSRKVSLYTFLNFRARKIGWPKPITA